MFPAVNAVATPKMLFVHVTTGTVALRVETFTFAVLPHAPVPSARSQVRFGRMPLLIWFVPA